MSAWFDGWSVVLDGFRFAGCVRVRGWLDGYMDTWMNGCMDAWMHRRMNE